MYQLRETVCQKFNIKREDLELSMGMSGDYEIAVRKFQIWLNIYKNLK